MSATHIFWSYASQRDPGYYAVVWADTGIESEDKPHMIAMCGDQGDALMIAAALNNCDETLLDTAHQVGKVLEGA